MRFSSVDKTNKLSEKYNITQYLRLVCSPAAGDILPDVFLNQRVSATRRLCRTMACHNARALLIRSWFPPHRRTLWVSTQPPIQPPHLPAPYTVYIITH